MLRPQALDQLSDDPRLIARRHDGGEAVLTGGGPAVLPLPADEPHRQIEELVKIDGKEKNRDEQVEKLNPL